MSKAPAIIAIVRHGARLDAANSTWHLSSPTPYDPPLTYGGWTQSRALGTRIGTLLQARELSVEAEIRAAAETSPSEDTNLPAKRKRTKHQVIIHTSPFLRCLQTSIAISSGLAQNVGRNSSSFKSSASGDSSHLESQSPIQDESLPTQHGIDGAEAPSESSNRDSTENVEKTLIRVDAFLGEWLSPDYFESITPPPSSTMMIASAKATLLRPSEEIPMSYVSFDPKGQLSGGWSKGYGTLRSPSRDDSPLFSISSMGSTLPHVRRERASTHGSVGSSSSPVQGHRRSSMNIHARDYEGYIPPIPTYAVSPVDPIPVGYVGHAKDACAEIDFAWDSMREPQNWGTGGELGEEWSAMHKRFRKGLDDLIAWYKVHEISSSAPDVDARDEIQEELDQDTDLVVILVTHGAGCNALIGALTNHPALLDVGMASLTMAVRKDHPRRLSLSAVGSITNSPPPSRRGSVDIGPSDEYDMRLVASIDHLRSNLGFPTTPAIPLPIPEYRRDSPELDRSHHLEGHGQTRSSALGSIRRPSLSGSSKLYAGDRLSSSSSKPTGLWGQSQFEVGLSQAIVDSEEDELAPLPSQVQRTVDQHGLWGGANVTGSRNDRVMAPKRRWTVTEQESLTQ